MAATTIIWPSTRSRTAPHPCCLASAVRAPSASARARGPQALRTRAQALPCGAPRRKPQASILTETPRTCSRGPTRLRRAPRTTDTGRGASRWRGGCGGPDSELSERAAARRSPHRPKSQWAARRRRRPTRLRTGKARVAPLPPRLSSDGPPPNCPSCRREPASKSRAEQCGRPARGSTQRGTVASPAPTSLHTHRHLRSCCCPR
mmetsp:Transcript_13272/g.38142  ORF Transcript_13272/g.38142 Transcript_13272/m.38142 type:complete len:205 (+) Transcript_13272:261-875(+)